MVRFKVWASWILIPAAMRRAGALAVLIVVAGTALLYQTNVRADRPPEFGRGGEFAGSLTDPEIDDFTFTTAAPSRDRNGATRSSAVLRAPETDAAPGEGLAAGGNEAFPAFGRYVYAVSGHEEATAFGRRDYPPEMTITAHRTEPSDPSVPQLADDEMIFDLYFSDDHEEREIIAFRKSGLMFTYEAGSVSFGFTQTNESTYEPPMLQIPLPLTERARVSGTSNAQDGSGNTTRTEDWTVAVAGTQEIEVLGEPTPTWVVKVDRRSRPGGSQDVQRTRTYWFDPERSIWVRWQETFRGAQDFGPGTFDYSTEFEAHLTRIEPL